jgi:hypothetical protein
MCVCAHSSSQTPVILKPAFLLLLLPLVLFAGATTQCEPWPPTWFHESKFFRGVVFSPTPNPQPRGPGTTLRLALTLRPVWHG